MDYGPFKLQCIYSTVVQSGELVKIELDYATPPYITLVSRGPSWGIVVNLKSVPVMSGRGVQSMVSVRPMQEQTSGQALGACPCTTVACSTACSNTEYRNAASNPAMIYSS